VQRRLGGCRLGRAMTYHLDTTPPPNLDDPDWPTAGLHIPADYAPLGYMAWLDMAERRGASGERQRYCRACQCWRWERVPCPEATGTPKPRK